MLAVSCNEKQIKVDPAPSMLHRQPPLIIFLDARRLLERRNVHARQRPLPRKLSHLLAELLDAFSALTGALGRDAHKVLEHLRAGFLLENQRQLDSAVQEGRDLLQIGFGEIARRECGCAKTNSSGNLGRCWVCKMSSGHGTFMTKIFLPSPDTAFSMQHRQRQRVASQNRTRTIDSDPEEIADLFDLAPGQTYRTKVPKNKVVVGSLGLKLVSVTDKFCRQCASIRNDLLGVLFERGLSRLLQGNCNSRDCLR
jgi:hypothetical protein